MKTLCILKHGKLLNRIALPDDWPDCVDPWYPKPEEGLTWELEDQKKTYESVASVQPDPSFEELKAKAIDAMLAYVATMPDAPREVKELMKGTAT